MEADINWRKWNGWILLCCLKKINRFLALMCFCFLNVAYAEAGEFNTNIENARLIVDNDGYKLNANINFNLSPIAVEALQNSIALVWNIRFRLYRQRSYLWDEKFWSIRKSIKFVIMPC